MDTPILDALCRREELYPHAVRAGLLYRIRRRASGALLARLEVEDVLQEASLTALRLLSARPYSGQPTTGWLLRIAENEIRNLARRMRRRKRPRNGTGLPDELLCYCGEPEVLLAWEGREPLPEAGLLQEESIAGSLGSMALLRWNQRVALLLQDLLSASGDTTSFLISRQSLEGVRKLRERGRRALVAETADSPSAPRSIRPPSLDALDSS